MMGGEKTSQEQDNDCFPQLSNQEISDQIKRRRRQIDNLASKLPDNGAKLRKQLYNLRDEQDRRSRLGSPQVKVLSNMEYVTRSGRTNSSTREHFNGKSPLSSRSMTTDRSVLWSGRETPSKRERASSPSSTGKSEIIVNHAYPHPIQGQPERVLKQGLPSPLKRSNRIDTHRLSSSSEPKKCKKSSIPFATKRKRENIKKMGKSSMFNAIQLCKNEEKIRRPIRLIFKKSGTDGRSYTASVLNTDENSCEKLKRHGGLSQGEADNAEASGSKEVARADCRGRKGEKRRGEESAEGCEVAGFGSRSGSEKITMGRSINDGETESSEKKRKHPSGEAHECNNEVSSRISKCNDNFLQSSSEVLANEEGGDAAGAKLGCSSEALQKAGVMKSTSEGRSISDNHDLRIANFDQPSKRYMKDLHSDVSATAGSEKICGSAIVVCSSSLENKGSNHYGAYYKRKRVTKSSPKDIDGSETKKMIEKKNKKKKTEKSSCTESGSNPDCKALHKKRTKFEGVRIVNGRIYDSENGKTCHQCRQKTMDLVVSCTVERKNKLCTLHYCYRCLWNRYGEKAANFQECGDWQCPRCRGICNCSFCRIKKGQRPTGVLGYLPVPQMFEENGPADVGTTPAECWSEASSLKHGNHKEPLGQALYLNVECKEKEKQFIYKKLRTLKKKFCHQAEKISFDSVDNPTPNIEVVEKELLCVRATLSRASTEEFEEGEIIVSPHSYSCSNLQGSAKEGQSHHCELAKKSPKNVFSNSVKQVIETYSKRMKSIDQNQLEDREMFKKNMEKAKIELEKNYKFKSTLIRTSQCEISIRLHKLKVVDQEFERKIKAFNLWKNTQFNKLKTTQEVERNEENEMRTRWLEEAKCERPVAAYVLLPLSNSRFCLEHLEDFNRDIAGHENAIALPTTSPDTQDPNRVTETVPGDKVPAKICSTISDNKLEINVSTELQPLVTNAVSDKDEQTIGCSCTDPQQDAMQCVELNNKRNTVVPESEIATESNEHIMLKSSDADNSPLLEHTQSSIPEKPQPFVSVQVLGEDVSGPEMQILSEILSPVQDHDEIPIEHHNLQLELHPSTDLQDDIPAVTLVDHIQSNGLHTSLHPTDDIPIEQHNLQLEFHPSTDLQHDIPAVTLVDHMQSNGPHTSLQPTDDIPIEQHNFQLELHPSTDFQHDIPAVTLVDHIQCNGPHTSLQPTDDIPIEQHNFQLELQPSTDLQRDIPVVTLVDHIQSNGPHTSLQPTEIQSQLPTEVCSHFGLLNMVLQHANQLRHLPVQGQRDALSRPVTLVRSSQHLSTACVASTAPRQFLFDPFQHELARISRESHQTFKLHEHVKMRLTSEYEEEIEETRRKYQAMLQSVEVSFTHKKKEHEASFHKIHMNRVLAEVFRLSFHDMRNGPPILPQGGPSVYIQQLFQESSQQNAQRSTVLPQPPSVRPLEVVYNPLDLFLNPSRPQHHQVEALAPHTQSFRPTTSFSASGSSRDTSMIQQSPCNPTSAFTFPQQLTPHAVTYPSMSHQTRTMYNFPILQNSSF